MTFDELKLHLHNINPLVTVVETETNLVYDMVSIDGYSYIRDSMIYEINYTLKRLVDGILDKISKYINGLTTKHIMLVYINDDVLATKLYKLEDDNDF